MTVDAGIPAPVTGCPTSSWVNAAPAADRASTPRAIETSWTTREGAEVRRSDLVVSSRAGYATPLMVARVTPIAQAGSFTASAAPLFHPFASVPVVSPVHAASTALEGPYWRTYPLNGSEPELVGADHDTESDVPSLRGNTSRSPGAPGVFHVDGMPEPVASVESPCAFVATTDTEYVVKLVSPPTVADTADGPTVVWATWVPPTDTVTTNPVRLEPPSSSGAAHSTSSAPGSPPTPIRTGGPGTWASSGVSAAVTAAGLEPTAFSATTDTS